MGIEEGGVQSLPSLDALIHKVLEDREKQKERDQKINGLSEEIKAVKGMICDPKTGRCLLPTKADLESLAEKQGTKADLSQFSGQELWNQIKSVPRYEKDIENIHLEKLKKNANYLREALNDPEIVERIADVICNDEGCKIIWNTSVDKVESGKNKGKKEHFLIKKK